MNTPADITPNEREFLMRIRSLLLMAVDLIEIRVRVGKHRNREVPASSTETVTAAPVYREPAQDEL